MAKKILSVVLVLVTIVSANNIVFAATKTELQQKLQTIEQEISELDDQGKEKQKSREELQKELSLIEEKHQTNISLIESEKQQIKNCETKIAEGNQKIQEFETQIDELNKNIKQTQTDFDLAKQKYYERIRELYVTGNQLNSFMLLFEANGIEDFLTKLQIISTYNEQTSEILNNFSKKQEKLESEKDEIYDKNIELKSELENLENKKKELTTAQEDLKYSENKLKTEEKEISDRKNNLETEIQKISDKTQEYSELRAQTAEELAEIDEDIINADKKYSSTTTTTTTTTTEPSAPTTKPNTPGKPSTTTTTTEKPQENNKYINLTYPVPSYTRITCEYMGYSGHTGCDFSTFGNVNQRVVAADSGTVIISKDLTNSDGSYRSYGRYIVIRHDNPTKSGKTVYTLYAHNNSRLVSAGEHVSKGQTIALSGSTGNSTGPHCHFEVRVGGSTQAYAVNPRNYL